MAASQCLTCQHLHTPEQIKAAFVPGSTLSIDPTCKAFPKGIPYDLFSDQVSHKQAYAGDRGLRWTAKDAAEQKFVGNGGEVIVDGKRFVDGKWQE